MNKYELIFENIRDKYIKESLINYFTLLQIIFQ
jgi:hypothetical protein